jgi:hypothetical protein
MAMTAVEAHLGEHVGGVEAFYDVPMDNQESLWTFLIPESLFRIESIRRHIEVCVEIACEWQGLEVVYMEWYTKNRYKPTDYTYNLRHHLLFRVMDRHKESQMIEDLRFRKHIKIQHRWSLVEIDYDSIKPEYDTSVYSTCLLFAVWDSIKEEETEKAIEEIRRSMKTYSWW